MHAAHIMKHTPPATQEPRSAPGFTLIELLITIAIIGLLAGVVMLNLNNARVRSRTTKAEADLRQLRTGIEQLAIDTNKWPNGCPLDQSNNPEVDLNQTNAGLISMPSVGVIDAPCEWTDADVASWGGPYVQMSGALDPWGTPYYFDPDYHSGSDIFPTLVSWGPDKAINTYNADDIYVRLH